MSESRPTGVIASTADSEFIRERYAFCFNAGIPGSSASPDGNEPTVASLAAAVELFRTTVRETDASSEAHAWVYLSSWWDGVSYGDTAVYVLSLGPRGGVLVERA